jgi:hypothetical protein
MPLLLVGGTVSPGLHAINHAKPCKKNIQDFAINKVGGLRGLQAGVLGMFQRVRGMFRRAQCVIAINQAKSRKKTRKILQ